jgi:hypothetical protein
MSPSEELRAAAAALRDDAQSVMPHNIATSLAHLLDLEESYLIGTPDNERLAHVRAALTVAQEVLGTTPTPERPVSGEETTT